MLVLQRLRPAGNNGYIWVGESANAEHAEVAGTTPKSAESLRVSMDTRKSIARVRNVILALAKHTLGIFDTRCPLSTSTATLRAAIPWPTL